MTLGIGLLGCGRFGEHLAQALATVEGATLAAIADPDGERVRVLAGRLGVPGHTDPSLVIDDPSVQAVIVATPHSSHEELVVRAAGAGKHVFCEKPIAVDTAAGYRMIDAAAAGVSS